MLKCIIIIAKPFTLPLENGVVFCLEFTCLLTACQIYCKLL